MNEQLTPRIQIRDFSSQDVCQPKCRVNIRSLKSLVFAQFSKDSVIYDVLLAEKDLLDVSEFLAKVDVWLKLLRRNKH